ncbi:MAG: ABC transporter permease [Candidatus Theseobacter exili]|nr:ABC transporter permease [Candidatus Theseobacter exili]
MQLFRQLGKTAFRGLTMLGGISILFWQTLWALFTTRPRRNLLVKQLYQVGVLSLPVVLLTGVFTGMVLAVQSYYQFHKITMETAIGILVGLSMTNELGPVLTAIMVAARVGAAMTAELGTMAVTEQVDALRAMGINSVEYLIVPRFIACFLMIPILEIFAVFIGICGGYVVGVHLLHINQTFYLKNMLDFTEVVDLMNGLIKTFVFAVLIVIICSYKGLNSENGAEGVGKATTEAVVLSAISILFADFFLAIILY